MMYFIFYGIFQIKWHLWPHFFRAFSLKYFIEYKIHHSVTVSHHALIITFMLWSWWSSCMKFLWSWITFFIYSLFMNPCLCTWTLSIKIISDKYASWVYQPLQNSTYCVTYTWYHQITQELMSFWCQIRFSLSWHYIMNVVCHLSVYWRQLMTRDQFPCALRNIWQLVSNVLGRVVIGRGGRTVSSLQQELKTFVLENHES